ncbi:MAG: hypothetical protein LIP02_01380 [Bacteroidales bacterium]|nr:hypothetical protein [Bacteroidales bacterium]
MEKEITLNTPIEQLVMPDKLRRRLQMLRCFTFGEAMRQDYRSWDDVNVKVVNAMKRFKQEYANVYTSLLGSSAEAPTQCVAWEERRFYVANNILNACIAGGQLDISSEGNSEELLELAMSDVIRAADVFLKAFAKECKPMEITLDVDIPDEDPDEEGDEEEEEEEKEGAEKESPTPPARKGDWIEITRRLAHDKRGHQLYTVGDKMRVRRVKTRADGTFMLLCLFKGKEVQVRPGRFEWKVVEKP